MKIVLVFIMLLGAQSSFAREIKVLSWNIFMLPTWARSVKQNERNDFIVKYLAQQDYDFILLQEAFTRKIYKSLEQGLKGKYPYTTGAPFRKSYMPVNSGLVIFSKHPLEDTVIYPYYYMKDADRFSSKGALFTTATLGDGQKVHLVNTHLQAVRKHAPIRTRQLNKIRDYILMHEKDPNIPLVLGGDLNIGKSYGEEFDRMMQILNVIPAKSMEPVGGLKYTSDCETNDLKRFANKEEYTKRAFIDYIFAYDGNEKAVEFKKLEVLDIEEQYHQKPTLMNLSDHHAVEAVIDLN